MKKNSLHLFITFCCAILVSSGTWVFAASTRTKIAKQSAIQSGTSVRTKTEATGLYDQKCYDLYYGCMDQFCIMDNEDGGSCACSDESIKLSEQLEKIKDTLSEAERIKTEEVEKVQAGANADIIFTGTRSYDKKTGDVAKNTSINKSVNKDEKRKALLSLWDDADTGDDLFEDEIDSIADKKGDALYNSANKLCSEQIGSDCEKDLSLLKQMYSRQIVSDCKGFANGLKQQENEANAEMNAANSAVRNAYKESFETANKYDRGECMVEYKKCMMGDDACGKNWENCVFTIASENMQNNKAKSTAGTKVKTINTYDITTSTMDILESKRYICERVLDSCVAVRDNVWDDFLREAAPTIRLAESKAESNKRQSCLSDISNCIQKACKDDIAGKGTATMDACLSRPDMARSFCKVEIDPCERMEPLIWGYVVDKLAAMRVDACTQEVRDCFTDDTRCGKDFSNCIGMDYNYIHDICPIDKLVVCKQGNPKFSMDDLDGMLMGLYLNIDNAALSNCQNLIDEKMTEICGSTTDCNRFATDETLGTGSVQSQKDGDIYRVTGMISFGNIKMGDANGNTTDGEKNLGAGEIGVADYIKNVREKYSGVKNSDGIISSIESELQNISGTINRTIEMIEQDPQIQYCINGRNLGQITGNEEKTVARFPHLLDSVKMQIAVSALRQAQDNYNAKITDEISKATKDASADLAQYMCQKIGNAGNTSTVDGIISNSSPLTPPYAISYDVASGLNNSDLTTNGVGIVANNNTATNKKYTTSLGGVTKTSTAVFNRDTRICHYCYTTTTQSCSMSGSTGLWGLWDTRKTSCEDVSSDEKCEDIQM